MAYITLEDVRACDECGVNEYEASLYEQNDGRILCNDCLDKLVQCSRCDGLFDEDDLVRDINDDMMCPACARTYLWWMNNEHQRIADWLRDKGEFNDEK